MDRRRLDANAPAQPLLLVLRPISSVGQTITCVCNWIDTVDPASRGEQTPVISGIPKLYRLDTGELPDSVATNGNAGELVFTYLGADIAPGEFLIFPPYDPALRTVDGGWVSPAIFAAL